MMRNGYQHIVLDHYVSRFRSIFAERAERLRAINTREQALSYQADVRKAIDRAFSPRPRKTALNPRVTGVVERDAYRVENVAFESRPGCLVTANVYVPAQLTAPAPGVIGACGHSAEGKACDLYSAFAQRLALNGFVVLVYDPFNQGERDQYHALSERDAVKGCCAAHNMMGKQLELLGEFFGMWRVWDGVRALDLLLSRPDVDASRVGVTGNSGGGTLSEWLWAVDDRFTMAAPSCFVTSFANNLENELPADCEQYPPGVVGAGLDLADLMIARAPKPALLLGQTYDYFDRRGLRQAHEELRDFCTVLGQPDNAALFIGPQGHGYSVHNQEAMIEFFTRNAGLAAQRVKEPEDLGQAALTVTPDANVVAAGATPIYELIASKADHLRATRKPLTPEALKRTLSKLLGVAAERNVPHYRIPRPVGIASDLAARYAVETEGHIRAMLWKRLENRAHDNIRRRFANSRRDDRCGETAGDRSRAASDFSTYRHNARRQSPSEATSSPQPSGRKHSQRRARYERCRADARG